MGVESLVSKTNELESAKQIMDLEIALMQEQHCKEIENEKKNHQKIKNELGWNEKKIESMASKTNELESAKQNMDLEIAQIQEQHCIEIEEEKKNHQKIKNELGWNEKEIESMASKTNELESAKQSMDIEMAQMQEQHRIEIEKEKKNHQKIKTELGWNEKEVESLVSKTNELESAKQNMDLEMAQMQEQHHIEIEKEKKNHTKINTALGCNEKEVESLVSKTNELESAKTKYGSR